MDTMNTLFRIELIGSVRIVFLVKVFLRHVHINKNLILDAVVSKLTTYALNNSAFFSQYISGYHTILSINRDYFPKQH
jgi:hypothetical protein